MTIRLLLLLQISLVRPTSSPALSSARTETTAFSTLTAKIGKQNPPEVGKEALLVVRPENLSFASCSENAIPVKIVNTLFEGDKIDYHVQVQGIADKTYSMGIPFLPGMQILDVGLEREASFVPQAGVIIRR